jgi:hypothetical protein
MNDDKLVPLENICNNYQVEISFIQSLSEFGLIEIIKVDETSFVEAESLGAIEKMMHLYFDLEINLEGIDAIRHLLLKMEEMQKELSNLKNKQQ